MACIGRHHSSVSQFSYFGRTSFARGICAGIDRIVMLIAVSPAQNLGRDLSCTRKMRAVSDLSWRGPEKYA
jgi:hypothetical protein